MELKTLYNKDWQYRIAGLKEAYHIVYYIPHNDVTTWSNRVLNFKARENEQDYQQIKQITIDAFQRSRLEFDFVTRVLGHNETSALKNASIEEYTQAIAVAINATYLPQLLNKYRSTRPLHKLKLQDRQAEVQGVFFIKDEKYDLNNKKILIIDDITTSCTTVAEMIKTLKAKWPNIQCYLFCLARTERNDPEANLNI